MEVLNVNLKHCYGITSLDYKFDFRNNKDIIIYAPNGIMKTSFNKTINDYIQGSDTKDEFFPKRISKRDIIDDFGNSINPDNLLCFASDDFELSENRISNLLVDSKLKKRYDDIKYKLGICELAISNDVRMMSGVSIDTMLNDLRIDNIKDIEGCFTDSKYIGEFREIKYDKLFNVEHVKELYEPDNVKYIDEYIKVVNDILQETGFFVKNVFELYQLRTIYRTLDSNGYFEANHKLSLYDSNKECYIEKDKSEIEKMINDLDLKIKENKKVERISKSLTKNISTRNIRQLISNNKWIIPLLKDIENCKKEYWKYIYYSNTQLNSNVCKYVSIYEANAKEIQEIFAESKDKNKLTKWNEAVNIFNSKFINMPFRLEIENVTDVILNEQVCTLKYIYNDGVESINVDKDILIKNLSKGERRAFNILNFIFEIEYRKYNGIETFVVLDDIADSFDYKNKYAIVELLKELNNNELFHLIILTHNFDFYRLCASSLNVNTRTIITDKNELRIVDFYYKKNIFNKFKRKIKTDSLYFIASIPFVRNIIELMDNDDNSDYLLLTSALHYKKDTKNIKVSNINEVYKRVLNIESDLADKDYLNLLFETADSIRVNNVEVSLENKLCLSIAIRIKFEMYMISLIDDILFLDEITSNQTSALINKCKGLNLFNDKDKLISDKVSIMVSQNIHVNAFMYEPIIDMSDDELISLYNEVKELHM